ncbi:MazG-like family protein [Rhodopseudomonas sp. G2_2311]|uniref:MazG-like family protein n=1 Tax=Rhodopseudomonas sp. G2_2311 TaxID=3114287 RepID=UPI0039C5F7F6
MDISFRQFSETNVRRSEGAEGFNHPLDAWSTSDWFTAFAGEAGEAGNIIKKLNRYRDGITGNKETHAELVSKLRRELGDAFIYLDLLSQSLGFSIGDAAVEAFNAKSKEIGCPILIGEG